MIFRRNESVFGDFAKRGVTFAEIHRVFGYSEPQAGFRQGRFKIYHNFCRFAGENISAKDVERKFIFRNGKTEIFFRGVSGRVFSRRAGKNFYSAETLALIIRVFITLEKGFVFFGVSVRVKVEFYFIHYLV